MVFSCYLPPESSPWGRDASSFFSHLLTQIYIQYDIDAIFICGDFNARIGNLPDFDKNLDNIPPKLCIDHTQNQNGNSFIEFLNDCNFCVLNGRFDVDLNDYTFQSTRGHSVVDYICVPHDIFNQCSNFRVIPCNSIVENAGIVGLQGENSRIPDHGFLNHDYNVRQRVENFTNTSTPRQQQARGHKFVTEW